jgi:hypothetical protein
MVNVTIYFKDIEPGQGNRLAMEWLQLHPLERAYLLYIAEWLKRKYGFILTITCLARTPEENMADGGKKQSSHLTLRAGDLSTNNLGPAVIDAMIEETKRGWGTMICIVYHKADTPDAAFHLHTNINFGYQNLGGIEWPLKPAPSPTA